jgi:hypothetical protein
VEAQGRLLIRSSELQGATARGSPFSEKSSARNLLFDPSKPNHINGFPIMARDSLEHKWILSDVRHDCVVIRTLTFGTNRCPNDL